jgi:hypothetical protein
MSQYGYSQGYGQQVAQPSGTGAMIRPPSLSDLGGQGQQPWIQFPFFPTAPFVSTSPNVGRQTRYYGATVLNSDSDYTVNSETVRTIQFDIPCRIIAINGGGVYYDDSNNIQSLPVGYTVNDLFLFRLEYTTGDKLHTGSRLASTCIGNAENPGEIGGVGFTVDQGSSIQLIITPLISNLRIDITLHCLEIRGQRNFN